MKRVALLALVLAGCATQAKFQTAMDGWLGRSESDLVGQFGPPGSVYPVNGHEKILTYARGGQIVTPGPIYSTMVVAPSYNAMPTFPTVVSQQGAPTVMQLSCTVNFTVTAGRITRWSANGNHCIQ